MIDININQEDFNRQATELVSALMADKFDMNDSNRIHNLSTALIASKNGWLDEEIRSIIKMGDIPNFSDEFLSWNVPEYYNYLRTIPRYYWFILRKLDGVAADDLYIDNNVDDFIHIMHGIKNYTTGRLLFYEINHSYVSSIIRVNQPCLSNAKAIGDMFQKGADNIYQKFTSMDKNTQWKVMYEKIYAYYDIPVTLRQLEKRLYLIV